MKCEVILEKNSIENEELEGLVDLIREHNGKCSITCSPDGMIHYHFEIDSFESLVNSAMDSYYYG